MRTIESLQFTLGVDSKRVTFLDRCRRKRHTAVYERVGAVSDIEANELIEAAKDLRRDLDHWLHQIHPTLI